MAKDDAKEEKLWQALRDFLLDLRRLNPDYPMSVLDSMVDLAKDLGGSHFQEASGLVEDIMAGYLDSPQKRAGGEILQEYYGLLESEERRLLTSGEINSEADPETYEDICARQSKQQESSSVMALVPRENVPPLTRFVVLNRSHMPPLLAKAADAYRRRNVLVDTVVELGLRILWTMDAKQSEIWILGYLDGHRGQLDPDVIRDLLRILQNRTDVSLPLLEWIVRWCGDAQLLDNWPNVIFTGDRVLCNHAVGSWLKHNQPRNPSVAHLALLFKNRRLDDETLLHWVESALGRLAECVLSIMSLEVAENKLHKEQFGIALHGELRRLASVYPLVMMVGNQLLSLPDGAHDFALAVFGLAGESLRRWDDQLNAFSRQVIRRMFMLDMRANKTPVDTIKRLTFGDDNALRMAMSQLDLVSEHFDSMKQRDVVVEILLPFYASYRRDKFLAMEVTRRFRIIMRLLHEDYLNDVLTDEHLQDVKEDGTVFEISAMMSEARRYLNRRRDKQASLEKLLATRCEFEESTRKRRLGVIRRELWGKR